MFYETFPVGAFQCNCSILGCHTTKEAIIIDPGDEADRIIQAVKAQGLTPKYLLHTHAHLDHVGATHEVQQNLGGEACLHKGDQFLFDNVPTQAALFNLTTPTTGKIDQWIDEGDEIKFGDYKITVFHTPGHTPGSLSFLLEQNGKSQLFTGDTLFARSIGRTDLWGGDFNQIIKSIREKLFLLDDDTIIHAGHGPDSTIGTEKSSNPFLQT